MQLKGPLLISWVTVGEHHLFLVCVPTQWEIVLNILYCRVPSPFFEIPERVCSATLRHCKQLLSRSLGLGQELGDNDTVKVTPSF